MTITFSGRSIPAEDSRIPPIQARRLGFLRGVHRHPVPASKEGLCGDPRAARAHSRRRLGHARHREGLRPEPGDLRRRLAGLVGQAEPPLTYRRRDVQPAGRAARSGRLVGTLAAQAEGSRPARLLPPGSAAARPGAHPGVGGGVPEGGQARRAQPRGLVDAFRQAGYRPGCAGL